MKRSLANFVLIMLFAGGVLTAAETSPESRLSVKGGRFLTLNTVIRVNQIEAARNLNEGEDEAAVHTPETVAAFRDAVSKGFPGAKMTTARLTVRSSGGVRCTSSNVTGQLPSSASG